jgi:hypothetical protein
MTKERIIGIINKRMDIHIGFINNCMDHGIEPAASVSGALMELRSLLREIERQSDD